MLITILIFLIALSILVVVHEFGHFIAARIIGVKVEKFAIGFPPKIWSIKKGETEYVINALPLGGYVKLKGESENEENVSTEDKTNLLARTPLEQFFVFVSGVVLNVILGIILIWLSLLIGSQTIIINPDTYQNVKNNQKVVVEGVEKGTPAEAEGIQNNDIITKIDDVNVYQDTQVLGEIQKKISEEGAKVKVTVLRDGKEQVKNVSTYKSKVQGSGGNEVEINRIGLILRTEGNIKADPFTAFVIAIKETWRIFVLTLIGILNLFYLLLTKFQLSPAVSGPVGIATATSYFASLGFGSLLQFMAVISISLAVFNILPIPALDGGQIFFTFIESIFRKKFSIKVKNIIQLTGFTILILLMIIVTVRDLNNLNFFTNLTNIFKR